jgi:hypothetical protein
MIDLNEIYSGVLNISSIDKPGYYSWHYNINDDISFLLFFDKIKISMYWPFELFISLALFYFLYPIIFRKTMTDEQKSITRRGLIFIIPTWLFILIVAIVEQIKMIQYYLN